MPAGANSSLHQFNPLHYVLRLPPFYGRILLVVVAALLCALIVAAFRPALATLEERLGALGWTLSANTTVEERIILVTIDEQSIAEVGVWPGPRDVMANLVTAIDEAGAQLQMHDIFYTEPAAGDDQFLAALQNARGAILAQVPVLQSDQVISAGQMTHPLQGVACDAAGSATQNFIGAHSGLAAIPKGHISMIFANDGSIQKVPAMVCVNGEVYPALAISALLEATGSERWAVTLQEQPSLFGAPQSLSLDAYPGLDIPLDQDGNLRISYDRSPESFQAISASDVLRGDVPAGMLDNAWVLVGITAAGTGDIVPTPYSGATPGVELQARILSSLVDDAVPYTPGAANWLLGLLSIGFALVLLTLAKARDRVAAYGLPAAGILLPLLALTLHIELVHTFDMWLGWLFPALFGLVAASLLLLLELSRVRMERSRVYDNLASYLPSDIATEIAYSLPNSSIDAKRCQVTLLSADLRNFSAFSEARPPEESAAVLHFFFTRATQIVERHGGRIHEFKGDGLLAMWDGQGGEVADQALTAAHELQDALHQEYLLDYAPAGLEPLALGIGIEQGPALMGSIGPAHRRSHTLLGDTVTITLRIQEMTAELAQPILLGECIARQLGDTALESQGSYLLHGLRIPHVLFAPQPTGLEQRVIKREQSNFKPGLKPSLKVVAGGLKKTNTP